MELIIILKLILLSGLKMAPRGYAVAAEQRISKTKLFKLITAAFIA